MARQSRQRTDRDGLIIAGAEFSFKAFVDLIGTRATACVGAHP